jgi:hypothetical protein
MMIKGTVKVYPTEDLQKIKSSILNIFPEAEMDISSELVKFHCDDAGRFKEKLYDQKIRDTAIMVLERGLKDDSTSFQLNKQAAFMGKINFSDGDSALFDIEISVEDGALNLIEEIRPL